MIINHSDHGLTALQDRIRENAASPPQRSRESFFDLVMNKNLSTAPPSTVPAVSTPGASGILQGGEQTSSRDENLPPGPRVQKPGPGASQGMEASGTSSGDASTSGSHTMRQKIDFGATHPHMQKSPGPRIETADPAQETTRQVIASVSPAIIKNSVVSSAPKSPAMPEFIDSMLAREKADPLSRDDGAAGHTPPSTQRPAVNSAALEAAGEEKVRVSTLTLEQDQGFSSIKPTVTLAGLESSSNPHDADMKVSRLELKNELPTQKTEATVSSLQPEAGQPGPEQRKAASRAYQEHAAFKSPEINSRTRETESEDHRPGRLAARFESANRSDAIGYDRRGGTCYGIYQLSSNMGTMGEFLDFLEDREPELASRLRQAGPMNTEGRTGSMPEEWQRIDRENPELFSELQHEFIHHNFYLPAARGVESRTGLDMQQASPALREVLWSTAVQHGVHGSMNIFQKVAGEIGYENVESPDREMIEAVYAERSRRFTGSTEAVQSAVQSRFQEEMKQALAMLPGSMETQA
ncbi:hypothetical protein Dthio_PD1794 [Desulfonatronospira thiodismutans ASO3-1]|uniref:Type VI secretion system spike protein VgrG3-like C-terminal domain-containing protein n=1 Tax=Desulfonatronospira thiodismutans ASO3-1 TaxID=555779 RepID=D6SNV9_9BACT|nr:hypothetical protein [Desulfonatronospira thiodismutans]EFI34435.1 hypothetical protein Dthio_PD1794 [Desulfonatronospira thiodismutans ASO3-1]